MLLRNKAIPTCVAAVCLFGLLGFGQTPTQNPTYQPGQQGQVQGGVIQPIDDSANKAQSAQPTASQSQAQPAAPAQNQQGAQPQTGQQGKDDNGLIMPIDDGSQPANAQGQQPAQNQPTQNAQPQPGQQGQSDNGLIMPIENGAQPANNAPANNAPATTAPAATQNPSPATPNQPSDTVTVPVQQQGRAPDSSNGQSFTFRANVEEVRLHATVVDDRQHIVTNLDKNAFTVYEDGQIQQIKAFRQEDVPVALGVVIDNSGSMRDKRPAVNAATINLVKASNAEDAVFVVNFNDDYYLDQDYTAEVPKLKQALEHYETRGGTALYDAVLASNAHIMKAPKMEKKVLFVVTDGEDDASLNTLEQAVRQVQQENGPMIYTIGILDDQGSHKRRAQRALRELAESTGGVAFFPASLDEVNRITEQIARDIRNQYTISYKPTNPQSRGGYRQVKVEAKVRGNTKLQVRTRSGYYAGQGNAPAANTASKQPQPAPTSAVR